MHITEELELSDDFTWQWKSFTYNREEKTIRISVVFKEGLYPHERGFKFPHTDHQQSISSQDVYKLLSGLEWYDKKKEVK